MRSRNVVLTALLGLAALGGTVLQARAFRSAPPPAAAPVAADSVRSVAAEGRVVAYPGSEVRVAAERSGRLVRVLVDEGDPVRRGDLLAEIESEELRAALEEARARVSEAEAELRLAEANGTRRERLVEEEILAVHDLDQSRRDVETTQARLATSRALVSRYGAQLRKTRILAPISGTVTVRRADAGETIDTGDELATIADLTRLRIEGEADEADAGALREDAFVTITADGYPGKSWRGRIEEIADAVTPRRLRPEDPARPTDTRVLAVKVAFSEPTPLKLGTTVELRIEAR